MPGWPVNGREGMHLGAKQLWHSELRLFSLVDDAAVGDCDVDFDVFDLLRPNRKDIARERDQIG